MDKKTSREAFEAWAGSRGMLLDRGQFGRYTSLAPYECWPAWQAATLAERERAAKACEAEHVGDSVEDECDNKGDYAYNMALRHAAAAIRKGEPS